LGLLKRQAILTCITICFAAMVTGVPLQLHLRSEAHSEKQDSERCSLCQQLLLTPGKFILEPELAIETTSRIYGYINFHSIACIKQLIHRQFGPRPPPTSL